VLESRRYVVTVDVPIYMSVRADEDMAADLAETYWKEQGVAEKIEAALEETDWYVGDPYEEWDVSEDESDVSSS
jgi:hypothetical protein